MKKLKQDLSVDDVYTIIQDFDEDGGGEVRRSVFCGVLGQSTRTARLDGLLVQSMRSQ